MAKNDVPKFEETTPVFEETTPVGEDSASAAPSTGTAVARGLGTGVTFGAQPVLAGAGAAALQAISPLTGVDMGPKQGANLPALLAAYKEMQKQEMQKNQAAQAAHPVAFGAAQVAGSIPTSVAAGAAGLGAGAQGALMGEGTYLGETDKPTLGGATGSAITGALLGKGAEAYTPALVKGGAKLGGAVVGGLKKAAGALGDAASAVAEKVAPTSMKEGFQAAQEGVNMPAFQSSGYQTSPSGIAVASQASKSANNLLTRMISARNSLGQDVGNSIQNAAAEGRTINLNDTLQGYKDEIARNLDAGEITQDEADRLNKAVDFQLYQEAPQEAEQLGTVKQVQKFAPDEDSGEMAPVSMKRTVSLKGASPEDLENVQNTEDVVPEDSEQAEQKGAVSDISGANPDDVVQRQVSSQAKIMQPATEGVTRDEVPVDQAYQSMLRFRKLSDDLWDKEGSSSAAKLLASEIRDKIKSALSDKVPEFAQASQRFDLYNKFLPETIMAKGESPELAEVRFGDTPKAQLKLKQATEDLLTNLNKPDLASKNAKQTFGQLDHSLDLLSTYDSEMQRLAEMQNKPYESIFSKLGLNKDEIMNYLQKQSQRANVSDTYMGGGNIDLSAKKTASLTALAGKTGAVAGNYAGRLYSASNEALTKIANRLSTDPALKNLGDSLNKAISKGDIVTRNAAIFAIEQNPKARSILDPNLKEDIKTNNTTTGTAPSGSTKYSF